MILVDTSVWIDFFRKAEAKPARLSGFLLNDDVLIHPWVLGELALGHLGSGRAALLDDLSRLDPLPVVADDEILELIERTGLEGTGVGWVDVQLLGSALIAGVELWTLDRRLERAADLCGVPIV